MGPGVLVLSTSWGKRVLQRDTIRRQGSMDHHAAGGSGPIRCRSTRKRPFTQELCYPGRTRHPEGLPGVPDTSSEPGASPRNTRVVEHQLGSARSPPRPQHARHRLAIPAGTVKGTESELGLPEQAWRKQARLLGPSPLPQVTDLMSLSFQTGHCHPPAQENSGDQPGHTPVQRMAHSRHPTGVSPLSVTMKEPDCLFPGLCPQGPSPHYTLSKAFLRLRISPSHAGVCLQVSPYSRLRRSALGWGLGNVTQGNQTVELVYLDGWTRASSPLPPLPERPRALALQRQCRHASPGLLATQPRCIPGRRRPRPEPHGTGRRSSRNLCGGTGLSLGGIKTWQAPGLASAQRSVT